jgi:thiol:disulfide interchange protein DsbD
MVRRVPLLALLLALAPVAGAEPVAREHLTVELVAEHTHVAPGGTLAVGLRLVHEPHWHTYWLNPGDSGLATRIAWTLPVGVVAGPIEWPAPRRLPLGELTNFGYDGELVLPVTVRVPAGARTGADVVLSADASWLVCKEECIPGDATLTLAVPVADAPPARDPRWAALFDAARRAAPVATDWRAEIVEQGAELVVTTASDLPLDVARLELFPVQTQVFATEAARAERIDATLLRLRGATSDAYAGLPERVDLVLVEDGPARRAFALTARRADAPPAGASTAGARAASAPPQAGSPLGAGTALAFALLGGVLLNLMPCVFPVLALKALSLADIAHERARARRHALAYLGGVLATFVALAGVLLALRSAGAALGWGFQLQVPWVIGALALLMLATGLGLSGVFAPGGAWTNAGHALASRDGATGAFFTGALAVVVASPCTAPFMGPALGYAVTQPAPLALGVFAALGLGLALPLVALAFVPALARALPRPGPWMETLKQALAFPMYATALWLAWVLGRQVGVDGMTRVLAGAVALAFALWLLGRGPARSRAGAVARAALIGAGLAAGVASLVRLEPPAAPVATDAWAPYSAERLAALRAAGRPVFVNMTAAWCITCLANERAVLATRAVEDALARLGVTRLKGDWTQRDAAITAYLAQFGRNGVPLYVVYPADGGAPVVLPQILTAGAVLDALAASTTASNERRSSP